jgi:hypothetical protein
MGRLVEWSMGGSRRFVYYGMVGERERLFIDGCRNGK